MPGFWPVYHPSFYEGEALEHISFATVRITLEFDAFEFAAEAFFVYDQITALYEKQNEN